MVQDKRRRRKKVRIDNSSSESSSDESERQASEDVEMASESISDSSSSDLESEHGEPQQDTAENARLLAHKAPAQLEDFDQTFLGIVTSQFGDDLENLRKAPDFKTGSLELLISGLKQGVNIFDDTQKKLLL